MYTFGSNIMCIDVSFGRYLDVPAFFNIKSLIITDGNMSSLVGILIGADKNYLFKDIFWSLV